jgi:acyl carrier protein
MTPTRERVAAAIQRFLAESSPLGEAEAAALVASGSISAVLDSLNLLDLVCYLEAELGVKLRAVDLTARNFSTVDRIAALFTSCAAAPPSQP